MSSVEQNQDDDDQRPDDQNSGNSPDDEIVFQDVSFREPLRLRRPDRDLNYACLAYGSLGPNDLPIYLDRASADRIERHALSDVSVELGGVLLGQECIDEETGKPFVKILQSLEAKHFENSQASFTYTHDSWDEINRERDDRFPELEIVGWYHTHPNFGIFLSGHDQFIQRHFFGQPLQIAYVVDPIRQTRGFFQWRSDGLAQVEGYYLFAPRTQRLTLARSVNELEGISNDQSEAVVALSPRLEAGLMAMLNQPRSFAPLPDRGQNQSLIGLIGMILGGLIVSLVLWIVQLNGRVSAQAELLSTLEEQLEPETEEEPEIAILKSRLRAKERALDSLLGEINVGDPPERLIEAYTRVAEERDRALRDQSVYDEVSEQLTRKNTLIERLNESLKIQDEKLKSSKKNELRLKDLISENSRLKKDADEVEELRTLFEQLEDKTLPRKYTIAWYVGLVGWVVSILLGLVLVTVIARSGIGRPDDQLDLEVGGDQLSPPDRVR